MKFFKSRASSFMLLMLSINALGAEGFSSPTVDSPAKLYYRAFTIYTGQEACDKSPKVATLRIRVPSQTLIVGDKLQAYYRDSTEESDLIIEAYDSTGNFLPSVPISAEAYSIGRTDNYDPGIIYINSSMDYWEARRPGRFVVTARWNCATTDSNGVYDEVTIEVQQQED